MSIQPPTRIKLCAQVWRIVHEEILDESDGYMFGKTRPRSLAIEISPSQADGQKRDTLLHEVLHAVVSNCALGMSDADEEQLVRSVTPFLLGVLRDNPKLTAFLLAP